MRTAGGRDAAAEPRVARTGQVRSRRSRGVAGLLAVLLAFTAGSTNQLASGEEEPAAAPTTADGRTQDTAGALESGWDAAPEAFPPGASERAVATGQASNAAVGRSSTALNGADDIDVATVSTDAATDLDLVPQAALSPASIVDLGLFMPWAIAVDPVTGRVFVAADQSVVTLSAEGQLLARNDGLAPTGLLVDGGGVWVASTDRIQRLDIATSTVTRTIALTAVGRIRSMQRQGSALWFAWERPLQMETGIGRVNLADDTRLTWLTATGAELPGLELVPGTSYALLHGPGGVRIYDISTLPPTLLPAEVGSPLVGGDDLVVHPGSGTSPPTVMVSGNPAVQLRVPTLLSDGTTLTAGLRSSAIDHAPTTGRYAVDLPVGAPDGTEIALGQRGRSVTDATVELGNGWQVAPRGLAFDASGGRLYAMVVSPFTSRVGLATISVPAAPTLAAPGGGLLGPFGRSASVSLPFAPFDVVVEPQSGNVAVSGEDRLLLFAPNGTLRNELAVPRARGIVADGAGGVYVAQGAGNRILRVDATTGAVTRSYDLSTTDPGQGGPLQLARSAAGVVFVHGWEGPLGASGLPSGIGVLDPATGAVKRSNGGLLPANLAAFPSGDLALTTAFTIPSPPDRWDLRAAPLTRTGPLGVMTLPPATTTDIAAFDATTFLLSYGTDVVRFDAAMNAVVGLPLRSVTMGAAAVATTSANGGWIAVGGAGGVAAFRTTDLDGQAPSRQLALPAPVRSGAIDLNAAGTVIYAGLGGVGASPGYQLAWLPVTSSFDGNFGEFTPVRPFRALDTRNGTGLAGDARRIGPGESVDVTVTGLGGVPTDNVLAVAVNITAVGPTAVGHVTAYPTGNAVPSTSTLNVVPGDIRPNFAFVRVGTGGKISVRNANGTTDLVVDLAGWFSTRDGPAGYRFHPHDPARLLDTRTPGIGVIPGGWTYAFDARLGTQTGVVKAVLLNVTVIGPSAPMHLTVSASGESVPLASNLNARAGDTVANLVVSRLGPDGKVALTNSAGFTHVAVDIVGWFDEQQSTGEGRFLPLETPRRAFDTRNGGGFLQAGFYLRPSIAGVPADAPVIPTTAQGTGSAVLNITVTQPADLGYVVAYRSEFGADPPFASNLNWRANQTVANAAVTRVGADGRIHFANFSRGAIHLIGDVTGVFTNSSF